MKSKKRLIKNTIIIAIGKFSTQAISFFLLPLYTSILTTVEYGTYDFINTLMLFLTPITTLLMEEAMFRFLIDADSDKEKKTIITQAIIFIIINLIITLTFLFIVLSIFKYKFKYYVMFFLLASVYSGLSQAVSRGVSKIKLYSLSAFISSALTLVLNVVFIAYFRIGIKGLLISYIIANIVSPTFVFIRVKIWHYISLKNINRTKIKEMIKYSIPLVPNSVSWVVINLSDRLIITTILGTGANGIYAIANKFPIIIDTLYGYFYIAWKEEASRAIKEENSNQYYNSIYKDLKRLLFSICVCLIAILPLTFNILVGKSFLQAYKYIPLLVVSIIFANISGFYGGIFSANKNTKVMGTSTIMSAIINVVINLILIKTIGLYAAILSTFIANFVVCIYRNIALKEYITFEKDNLFYFISTIILGLVILCYYSNLKKLYFIGFVIAFIYSIYINRNMALVIFNRISSKFRKRV
ncbi:oligosaccharide flippase family protein [Clostridium tyrobutyricum]|uniref:lipopolysaccharide biosynthesis protein n=1 Tax=Clostridium tyrobutyricum TaxID=1519 RepID=UPI0030D40E44